jgi:hypothetical protein
MDRLARRTGSWVVFQFGDSFSAFFTVCLILWNRYVYARLFDNFRYLAHSLRVTVDYGISLLELMVEVSIKIGISSLFETVRHEGKAP